MSGLRIGISAYYGAQYMSRVSTFKFLKIETVSTETVSTETVSTETVSVLNWLKAETVSTFKHLLFVYKMRRFGEYHKIIQRH